MSKFSTGTVQTQSNDPLIWLAETGYTMIEGLAGVAESDSQSVQSLTGIEVWQKQLLLEQLRLRKRSRKRFPDASKWIWTDRSLSQASDWTTADFKAQLIPANVTVLDACCGAGVDLVAMCQRQSQNCDSGIIGLDIDPEMVSVAQRNCALHGFTPQLRCEEFNPKSATRFAKELRESNQSLWLHVDPDRRPTTGIGERKTLQAEDFLPPMHEIELASKEFDGAIVKVAPSTQFDDVQVGWLEDSALRLWVGVDGEAKQQLLFLGEAQRQACASIAHEGPGEPNCSLKTAAVLLRQVARNSADASQRRLSWYAGEQSEACVGRSEEVGEYVFDLHAVLHSSKLASSWAEDKRLHAINDSAGFYTGSELIESEWSQCFRVVETLAWDDRKVRKLLRKLESGIVEVKNRLVKLDASAAQKRYSRSDGDRSLVLLVTKLGQRVRCIVAERC